VEREEDEERAGDCTLTARGGFDCVEASATGDRACELRLAGTGAGVGSGSGEGGERGLVEEVAERVADGAMEPAGALFMLVACACEGCV
jgi:hypothetical protein